LATQRPRGLAVDHQDHLLPEERCSAPSSLVSLGLLALGESPRGHKVFHHGTLFELVFDGVRMVRTGHFKKFLKMVFQLPGLVPEVTLSGCDILLIGVVRFLVIVIVTGSNYDPLGTPLFPLLPP
jgi:hypothetical protein